MLVDRWSAASRRFMQFMPFVYYTEIPGQGDTRGRTMHCTMAHAPRTIILTQSTIYSPSHLAAGLHKSRKRTLFPSLWKDDLWLKTCPEQAQSLSLSCAIRTIFLISQSNSHGPSPWGPTGGASRSTSHSPSPLLAGPNWP